jgi:hypothetical protein
LETEGWRDRFIIKYTHKPEGLSSDSKETVEGGEVEMKWREKQHTDTPTLFGIITFSPPTIFKHTDGTESGRKSL